MDNLTNNDNSHYFDNETNEKSFGLKVILTLVALMILSIMGIQLYHLLGLSQDANIPETWYSVGIVLCNLAALAGLWLTYLFKKIGVYLTCIALFICIVLDPNFSLIKTLAPLFTLFIYVGFGLFEIIPKWRFFE